LPRIIVRATIAASLGTAALLALVGCASIISGRQAEVAFDSVPANAEVVIRDKAGRTVASLRTPGVVSLKRNRRFFMPARYTADIVAPGYHAAQVPIRSTINPWIVGNVVVGGIPGLIVDAATGAAWMPRDSQISQQLLPLDGPQGGPYLPIGSAPGDAATNGPLQAAYESQSPSAERR
jgi:hypothetical protein